MKRLLAVIPLSFALFFTAASIDLWGDFIHRNPDRLLTFGVALIETWTALFLWGVTVTLALGKRLWDES